MWSWFFGLFPLLWACNVYLLEALLWSQHCPDLPSGKLYKQHIKISYCPFYFSFFYRSCRYRWNRHCAIFAPLMLNKRSVNKLQSCDHHDCTSCSWLDSASIFVLQGERSVDSYHHLTAAGWIDRRTEVVFLCVSRQDFLQSVPLLALWPLTWPEYVVTCQYSVTKCGNTGDFYPAQANIRKEGVPCDALKVLPFIWPIHYKQIFYIIMHCMCIWMYVCFRGQTIQKP